METNKKRIYVDMDGVLCDYNGKAKSLGLDPEKAQYVEGFYRDLKPIEGAIQGFETLCSQFDVYILSWACWDNPGSFADKVRWIDDYLPIARKRLILAHNKSLCKGDYIIDDRKAHKVDKFDGEWIKFGSEKFPDWNTVVDYILSKE